MRIAMRGIISRGEVANFLMGMIIRIGNDERSELLKALKFFTDRETQTWTLSSRKFLIKDLGDTTIERLINKIAFQRSQNFWLDNGHDERHPWYSSLYHQTKHITILCEAEYRNILSKDQQLWTAVRKGQRYSEGCKKISECNCKEDYILTGNDFTCTNCREKITHEKLSDYASTRLLSRLRVPAS